MKTPYSNDVLYLMYMSRCVRPDGEDGCWLWTGATIDGHGVVRQNGKNRFLHRFVYEHFRGPIPGRMVVRHKCNNRSCCNPSHLEVGTQQDNMDDMVAANRHKGTRGKRLGRTNKLDRLSPTIVDEMRRLARHGGYSQAALGKLYGVSQTVAGDAICGHTYRDASEAPLPRRGWGPGKKKDAAPRP